VDDAPEFRARLDALKTNEPAIYAAVLPQQDGEATETANEALIEPESETEVETVEAEAAPLEQPEEVEESDRPQQLSLF
jgi:hypothetical protein